MKTHFIVGMSRAGTTWLAKVLNNHPDVAAFGETAFWGRKYVEPEQDGRYSTEQMKTIIAQHRECPYATEKTNVQSDAKSGCLKDSTSHAYPELVSAAFASLPDRPTPADVFEAITSSILKAEGKSIAVEKTPHHLNWIHRISSSMPDARFVVLIRRPYEFVLSYKHQGDRKPAAIKAMFQRLYHPLACAFVWRAYMRAAWGAAEKYPQQTHVVYFEDMICNEHEVLTATQNFLGLHHADIAGSVPPDNTSFPSGLRPELNAADIFWINLIARREIKAMGIPFKQSNGNPLAILWSFVSLPWWSIRNLIAFSRSSNSTFKYLLRWISPDRPTMTGNAVR